MRFSNALAGFAALSPLIMAANPPSFFLLKTTLLAPPTGGGNLNGYMSLDPTFDYSYAATFYPQNADASFFSLEKTDVPEYDGHAYYALKYNYTKTVAPHANIVQLEGAIRSVAYWTEVNFVYDGHDVHGTNLTDVQKGFWLDDSLNLQWTNNFTDPQSGNFGGWLVCDWSLNTPQLFLDIGPHYGSREGPLSSNCARANISAIPI